MTSNKFYEAEVVQREDVVFIKGVATFETVAAIQKAITVLLQKNASASIFQVDFTQVIEVNSAALGLLVELKKYTILHKKAVVFLNLPEKLISLAQVCGVAEWLGLR